MKIKLFIMWGMLSFSASAFAVNLISIDFTKGQGDWIIRNVDNPSNLNYIWQQTANYGMKASAYVGNAYHESESWLISPTINLSDASVTLLFSHARRYGNLSQLSVRITSDGGTTWTVLPISSWPDGSNWTFVDATADLSAFAGMDISIAFVYTSTTTSASTWQIKTVDVIADHATVQIGDLYYNLKHDNGSIAEVTYESHNANNYSDLTSITIPSSVQHNSIIYSVSSIADSAFCLCENLTNISIPSTIKSIGTDAFLGCNGLVSIEINAPCIISSHSYYLKDVFGEQVEEYILGSNITTLGTSIFRGCSAMTSIDIPNSVTEIGWSAFWGCSSLAGVEIPNSVTEIGPHAFYGCTSLTSMEIPNSVTSIGYEAFCACSSLTNVSIGDNVTSIESSTFSGCSSLSDVYIGSNVTNIEHGAFWGCRSLKSVTIPNSVTSIESDAFAYCDSLAYVTIGSGVVSIGDEAFEGCIGLTSIVIPNNVTSIGKHAFSGCSNLSEITISNSVTCLQDYVFYGCKLISITIPNSVNVIGDGAFMWCDFTEIEIPNSVTDIGKYAFLGCLNLTNVNIPNSVISIGDSAFADCSSLTDITIPSSVTSIGTYAFEWCENIENIVVEPNNTRYDSRENCNAIIETSTNTLIVGCSNTLIPLSVTGIGDGAFWGPGPDLVSIKIPNSVISIGNHAFRDCYQMASIDIPNSVANIGKWAFAFCSMLTSITCRATIPPTCSDDVFLDVNKSIPLYVPSESINAYQSADQWRDFCTVLPINTMPMAINELDNPKNQTCKTLRNNQILILRGDKTYTVTGQEMK